MRREQLEHAIRASCRILGTREVIVVGSQAILGSFRESEHPTAATMSVEVDILPIAESQAEVRSMATLLSGAIGEFSDFDRLHGFSVDGVDLDTAMLSLGWRERLIAVRSFSAARDPEASYFTGLCLEPHDLCASKLCAMREKDRRFVASLLENGLVSPAVLARRLRSIDAARPATSRRALSWLESWKGTDPNNRVT